MEKKLLLFLFIVGGSIIPIQAVFAQGVGIGISPLIFEMTTNPGDIIENFVKVLNPSNDNAITVKMEVEDIVPSGEAGYVKVESLEDEVYSIAKWIKCEPEEFNLGPREEKYVKFTISAPQNAEPGGHYGSILARTKGIAGPTATGVSIAQRVGALVLLTVPGVMKEELAIKDFSAPRYSEHGPIFFAVRFENTGTVHVKPKGLITVSDWLGKKVTDIPFPEKNVLPKGIRKLEASLNQKWLWMGKYTATLTGSYGISNAWLIPVVITFWAFPWKIGLIILAVLILLILARKRFAAAFRILLKGEK